MEIVIYLEKMLCMTQKYNSCMTKIMNALIDNAKDFNVVTPFYNMLENSDNYSMTSRSLGNYYGDEIDDVNVNALDGKSFKYKTKIIGKTEAIIARPHCLDI